MKVCICFDRDKILEGLISPHFSSIYECLDPWLNHLGLANICTERHRYWPELGCDWFSRHFGSIFYKVMTRQDKRMDFDIFPGAFILTKYGLGLFREGCRLFVY